MYDKTLAGFRKRLNTQLISKTELALQAIKRYDESHSRVPTESRRDPKNLIDELEYDYSRLARHKKIELDRTYKVNLLNYGQQFYCLEMANYIFPMRIFIKNVKREGTLFIGYDQEFPGMYHKSRYAYDNDQIPDKNYDSKTVIDRDILITLKNKGNKTVHNVYFSIVAGSDLFMFDFKVEFLGFEKRDRSNSGNFSIKTKPKGEAEMSMPLLRVNTEPNSPVKDFIRSGLRAKEKERISGSRVRKEEIRLVDKQEMSKHSSRHHLMPSLGQSPEKQKRTSSNFNRTNSIGMLRTRGKGSFKEGQLVSRLEEAKRNKQVLQLYREKDRELRDMASRCKVMISQFQKVYTKQSIQRRKANRSIVMLLYSARFICNTIHLSNERTLRNQMSIKVHYLCNVFRKKLMQRKKEYCDCIPQLSKRITVDEGSGITLMAKLVHKHSQTKASDIVSATMLRLNPCFILNCAFNQSNVYRGRIRRIQRQWKSKHHNRIRGLLFFVDYHVERMTKKHSHLGIHTQDFYKGGFNRAICVEYVRDEGEKYRYIYQAYLRQLEDINEVVELNKQLVAKGEKNNLLAVPDRPTRPMHRFFRNLDILKSMVRTWFEIEYKKYSKKVLKGK